MRKSQKSALVAATVVGMDGGGVAFAYWTSTGQGDGLAKTGTSSNYTVTVDGNQLDKLYPGSAAATVPFHVTNPGSGTQNVSLLEVKVANPDGSPWTSVPGCDRQARFPTFRTVSRTATNRLPL